MRVTLSCCLGLPWPPGAAGLPWASVGWDGAADVSFVSCSCVMLACCLSKPFTTSNFVSFLLYDRRPAESARRRTPCRDSIVHAYQIRKGRQRSWTPPKRCRLRCRAHVGRMRPSRMRANAETARASGAQAPRSARMRRTDPQRRLADMSLARAGEHLHAFRRAQHQPAVRGHARHRARRQHVAR